MELGDTAPRRPALSQLEARAGSLRGRLVWAELLGYSSTYLELAVSGPFTPSWST
jgi:hypothetical protein